jgi:hypothetical protein
MNTFIADIFPRIQKYSRKLDDLTLLTNQHWVSIDSIDKNKTVYIFRSNNELLISINGKIEKGKWEYLGNNSILIDKQDETYLFKHGFLDENVFALKVDSSEEYAVFVNENKYGGELNSMFKVNNFLNQKYIRNPVDSRGFNYETRSLSSEKPNSISTLKAKNHNRKRLPKYPFSWVESPITIMVAICLLIILTMFLFYRSNL